VRYSKDNNNHYLNVLRLNINGDTTNVLTKTIGLNDLNNDNFGL